MEKLLIVGTESLAGSNLALALEDSFEVCGISRDSAAQLDGVDTAVVRREDLAGLAAQVELAAPRWIIHCPSTAAASWDTDPSMAKVADESVAAVQLTDWAHEHGARLTVLSTDAVFAGPRMFHAEDFPATASGPWASAARRVEEALRGTAALVVRTHAYGWSPQEDSFAEQIWSACTDRRPLAVDGRRHATPLWIGDLADFLVKAYRAEVDGLWHIAGAERTSPFRFACELAGAFGLPAPSAAATTSADPDALDQAETSLCSRRARRVLELSLPLLREGLRRFAAQADSGWRDRLRGDAWEPATTPRRAA